MFSGLSSRGGNSKTHHLPRPTRVAQPTIPLQEVGIDGRIVADHQAGKRLRIQNLFQRVGILVHAKEQHARLLRQKGPHTVNAPTRFVAMDHQGIRQQRTQHVELLLPVPRQLPQQRVGLGLAQWQTLQESQGQTDLGRKGLRPLGKGGLFGNTLRIKPPMCLTKDDADFLADCLDDVLERVTAKA